MKIQFKLKGLHCSACAAAVERSVKKLDGAAEVYVNFAASMLTLEADPEKLTADRIIQAVKSAGYDASLISGEEPVGAGEGGGDGEDFGSSRLELLRFIIALVFSLLLFYAAMHKMLHLPYFNISLQWNGWLQAALLIPVVLAGSRFYTSGYPSLLRLMPNMDSLVAICTTAAAVYSLIMLIYGDYAHLYFDSAGMIITLVMLGKYLEARSRVRATGAIRALMNLTPATAHVVDTDGVETDVPAASLKPGDMVRVRPGESVPADGVLTEGQTAIDESMLTGESLPVAKAPGSPVTGGSINGNGAFLCRIERTGKDTTIAQIIALVREAQGSRPPIARLADTVSGFFVWFVIGAALLTFCVWYLLVPKTPFADALNFSLAVLVIACPCALGLATPIALIVGIGRGAGLGILIKNGSALETAGKVSVIAFDKTGTVTEGHPAVKQLAPAAGIGEDELLAVAASAEKNSNHPLAAAIVRAAEARNLALTPVSNIHEQPGLGLQCILDGHSIVIGNGAMMKLYDIAAPAEPGQGSVVHVAREREQQYLGSLLIHDPVQTTAAETVGFIHGLGIRTLMLTGDSQSAAETVAAEIHIDDFKACLLPNGKAQVIKEFQDRGEVVAMVGDGINDAPALARANVGVSIASGTDIAMKSAGIVLMRHDLREVPIAIALSRATMRIIKENLGWAFGYNIICIPLAAGLFYHWLGWRLSPIVGACAMAFSSVSVVTNALRLRRFQP